MEVLEKSPKLDRSKPPAPGPLPKVSFPDYQIRELSNGLTVYIVENHEQPLVAVSIYIRGGSILDPVDRPGLAAVTSDMMTRGTTSRTAVQIADEIDFVGGSLHSSASWDAMTLSVNLLTKFLGTGIDLLSDALLNPTFPQEELDRVKLQRIAGLKQAKADAGFLADSLFSKLVYPDHPYGHEASGTEATLESITRGEIENFYREIYGPNNAFIVAAGDVPKEFIEQLEAKLSNWPRVKGSRPHTGDVEMQKTVRVGLVEKPSAVQSAIRVGHLGIPRRSEDYIPAYVMNMLLGGYFNSRINLNLREKNGFTYGARSYFDTRIEPGPFAVSTEVRTEVTVRAIEEILSEIRRIAAEPVSDEELDMVKNYVIGSFPLQIETPQQVASRVATIALYGLEKDYFDKYRPRVAKLTKEDLYAVAHTYLHPDHSTIVVSGNVDALKEAMKQFGTVTVYTAEGTPLDQ